MHHKFLKLLFIPIFSFALLSCTHKDFDADYASAESKMGMGDLKGAMAGYEKIARRYPSEPRRAGVLLRIADLQNTALKNGAKDAIKTLGALIKEYPFSEAAILGRERRAGLKAAEGDYDGVIEDLSALLKYFPDRQKASDWRIQTAEAFLSMKEYRQARVELAPLFDDPGLLPDIRERALFTAAESFFLEERQKDAIPYYQALINEFPKSKLTPEAKLHLATCVEEMGYLGVARDIARDARKDYPNKEAVDIRLKSMEKRGKQGQQSQQGKQGQQR